ncbi:MAG: GntR family transcriptional regulator [Thermovirga sp.]
MIPAGSIEDQAYGFLRKAILTRKILPGTRLSEPVISNKLGISRTPVRGAIKKLVAEGLVTRRNNQGAVVAKPTKKDIDSVYFMRSILEPQAARLACANGTPRDVLTLESLIRESEEAFRQRDLDLYISANEAVHAAIAALSGNRYLEQSIRNFLAITGIFLILYDPFYEMKENDKTAMDERAIVKAIASGDQDMAEEMMKQHIRDSWDLLDVERYEEILSSGYMGFFP